MMWSGALRGCLVAKFDSCNSLLSSVHTLLVNILHYVRLLYIKRKYDYYYTIILNEHLASASHLGRSTSVGGSVLFPSVPQRSTARRHHCSSWGPSGASCWSGNRSTGRRSFGSRSCLSLHMSTTCRRDQPLHRGESPTAAPLWWCAATRHLWGFCHLCTMMSAKIKTRPKNSTAQSLNWQLPRKHLLRKKVLKVGVAESF